MNFIIILNFLLLSLACTSEKNNDPPTTAAVSTIESSSKQAPEIKKSIKPEKAAKKVVVEDSQNTVQPKADKPKVDKPEAEATVNQAVTKKKAKVEVKKTKSNPVEPKPKKQIPPPPVEKPKIYFPDTLYNYGFIDESDTVVHTFRFINDGKEDLDILDVQVSCGCMIPKYPLTAIKPGRMGKIEVTFLSAGKIGSQLATIDVLTNARNPRQTLYLKGVVR